MEYYEWFDKKVKPVVLVNGDVSIREFGAIVYRKTLRGELREKPLTKAQKKLLREMKKTPE
jgi:hypothetical protein